MDTLKRIPIIILSTWKKWILPLIIFFSVFALLKWDKNNDSVNFKLDYFDTYIDPLLGTATLLLTLFLGYRNLASAWEQSLPKKITVHFVKGQDYIFTCLEAYLAHEGDIRSWGQQIARQMNGDIIDFFPYIDQKPPRIINNEFKIYEITFFITPSSKISNLQYKCWWDNDSISGSGNKEIIYTNNIQNPFTTSMLHKKVEDDKAIVNNIINKYHDQYGTKLDLDKFQYKNLNNPTTQI